MEYNARMKKKLQAGRLMGYQKLFHGYKHVCGIKWCDGWTVSETYEIAIRPIMGAKKSII